jgi:acetylxylan esterase
VALATALAAPAARAASLQPVSNWGASAVPADVSMYVYVPEKAAQNPPILTLIHYCGGTASAVFGQAQGGGLVKAADQYGFIMVVPSSGRCWDIVSNKTRTRDGGGDSDAIRQMVKYAVMTYHGNAERVYATGDSSGGMMTELLLALYPDVFKAGAAFAGMPAGCRGANETGSGGGYSNACAGGSVTHTPQEWGDIARGLDPGYVGYRPRIQLFHGDADTTIKYPNFTESIKEWTNLLGLAAAPTATEMGVQLGQHQATRQKWQNACGQVVVDAFTSLGGDHGPSDALFNASYVVPFLGLDKTGAVDPEIEQCPGGAGGGGGVGGAAGAGGNGGSSAASGAAGTASSNAGGVAGEATVGGAGNATSSSGSSSVGMGGSSSGTPAASAGTSSAGGPANPATGADVGSSSSGCAVGRVSSQRAGERLLVALGLSLGAWARRRRSRRVAHH